MVAFLEVATQNIMYGHMIWGLGVEGGGVLKIMILEGYRQYIDKKYTNNRQDIDKT